MSNSRPLLLTIALFLIMSIGPARAEDIKITHGLALAGPVKYAEGFTHFEYANPDAPKEGTIKLWAMGAFDSFNPFIVKGVPASGLGLIYDTLTVQSYDEPFAQYGLVADKIELPADRSWVIYHINPQARFHDGRPITAADVVFSFNTLTTKGDPQYKRYYADVTKVEALDERRVKFHLGDKSNPELALILGQLTVLPKHYWENREFEKSGLDVPLGGGPYKIKDFQPGRSISYARVEDYWARDLPVNKGRYNFNTITVDYYRDETVALQAFKSGEYDFRQENMSKAWATAYDIPAVREGYIIKEEVPNDVNQGMQCFVFNTRRPLFQDRRVREALSLAFDFEWTNKNLFHDQYVRSTSFFSNSELASSGPPTPEELAILEPYKKDLPPEVFTREFTLPKSDGSGNIRKRLRQASELLTEAGWVIKNKKRVNAKTGKPFQFEILLLQPIFERITLPFKKNLERLGIDLTIRVVDTSQYINRLNEFDYDMFVITFAQSESPGNEQRYYWNSNSADTQGSRNYAGIKNPAIDALIEKLIQAPDRKSLVLHTRALDRALLWGYYVIPQWHTNVYRLAYWNKFSRPEITPKYSLDIYSWWVDPEKEKRLLEYKNSLKRSGS